MALNSGFLKCAVIIRKKARNCLGDRQFYSLTSNNIWNLQNSGNTFGGINSKPSDQSQYIHPIKYELPKVINGILHRCLSRNEFLKRRHYIGLNPIGIDIVASRQCNFKNRVGFELKDFPFRHSLTSIGAL